MKKLFAAAAVVLLLTGQTLAAGSGSIVVHMERDGQVIPGGSLSLYPVCAEFDGPYTPEVIEKVTQYIQQNAVQGTTRNVGQDGRVLFDGLDRGLWLAVQKQTAEGYLPINPFCVQIEWDGQQVDAWPKIQNGNDPNAPQTGDEGRDRLWAALMAVSLAGLTGTILIGQKKHRSK